MRTLLFICTLLLAGCCFLPSQVDVESLPAEPETFIEVLSVDNNPDVEGRKWEVRVRFYETTEYDSVVQVLHLADGTVLVEAFKTPGGGFYTCQVDTHSSTSYGVREMLVYPGTVVGADWTANGFAELERSEAGDVTTNTSPKFNKKYRKKHETRGYVLEGDRSRGFRWKIKAWAHGVDVQTPPSYTITP